MQKTNVFQQNLDKLSFSKWIPLLFLTMTFSAVLPLYFENIRQLSGLVFLSILLFLSVVSFKNSLFKASLQEKTWLYIAIFYAIVLILSYLLRMPYTDDGEWRNAAPVFVFLISAWYFLSIRFNQQKKIIKYVALSSVFCAMALFIAEVSVSESLVGYRFGAIWDGARGLAATGLILPLTAGLFVVLWLKERSYFYLTCLIVAFILSGLNGSKTAFSIILLMVMFGMFYVFIWGVGLSKKAKWLITLLLIGLILASAWLAKSKILVVSTDISSIQSGDYSTSTGLRYAMFDISLQALKNNWLFGVGPSQYKIHMAASAKKTDYSNSVKEFTSSVMQIHNQYLMALLLAGVLGGITLLFLLTYPIKVFLSYFRRTKDPSAFIAMGLLFGVMFILLFGAVFTYTYTTIFYMLSVSALVSWFSTEEGVVN